MGPASEGSILKAEGSSPNTPVLLYYNLADEVTMQCDASQFGLGVALLQEEQPVANTSHARDQVCTDKELLAIVLACERFMLTFMAGMWCMLSQTVNHWRQSCRNFMKPPISCSACYCSCKNIPWMCDTRRVSTYIMKCDVCLAHQNAPHKETIIQHEITAWAWARVGADLCDAQRRTLLIVCDYFSGFIEVKAVCAISSKALG